MTKWPLVSRWKLRAKLIAELEDQQAWARKDPEHAGEWRAMHDTIEKVLGFIGEDVPERLWGEGGWSRG